MKQGTRIHFIGIGGSGMSGLATISVEAGMQVSGSDLRPAADILSANPILKRARVEIRQHDAANVPETGIVVYSKSIPPENVERRTALHRKLDVIPYGELVMRFAEGKKLIAVAGTHGKSTTTALIAHILSHAGWHISFLLGAKVPSLDGRSARFDVESDVFVLEADEYDRAFHAYRQRIAVVTNIDWDHTDTYPNYADILPSFGTFLRNTENGGTIVYDADDDDLRQLVEVDIGIDVRQRNITTVAYGKTHNARSTWWVDVPLYGMHNKMNAMAAAYVCEAVGIGRKEITVALVSFRGLERRMQLLGYRGSVPVHSDYAHHPSEIAATLDAVHEMYLDHAPIVVFQPHQQRRLTALFDDFVHALQNVQNLHIVREYRVPGRDDDRGMKSAKDLADALVACGNDAVYHESLEHAYDGLSSLRGTSPIILMGAGDIHILAKRLTEKPS